MAMECVIHYKNQWKYSKLKGLSEINKKQILEAKDLRCTLGGDNFHEEQCDAIPEKFDEYLHGIYLECYKKYVHFFIRREGQKCLVPVIFTSKNWKLEICLLEISQLNEFYLHTFAFGGFGGGVVWNAVRDFITFFPFEDFVWNLILSLHL